MPVLTPLGDRVSPASELWSYIIMNYKHMLPLQSLQSVQSGVTYAMVLN